MQRILHEHSSRRLLKSRPQTLQVHGEAQTLPGYTLLGTGGKAARACTSTAVLVPLQRMSPVCKAKCVVVCGTVVHVCTICVDSSSFMHGSLRVRCWPYTSTATTTTSTYTRKSFLAGIVISAPHYRVLYVPRVRPCHVRTPRVLKWLCLVSLPYTWRAAVHRGGCLSAADEDDTTKCICQPRQQLNIISCIEICSVIGKPRSGQCGSAVRRSARLTCRSTSEPGRTPQASHDDKNELKLGDMD